MKLMILDKNKEIDNNKLSILDFSKKLNEESVETIEAIDGYINKNDTLEHIAEETLDTIQVAFEILDWLSKNGMDIPQEVNRHNTKLISRGWTKKYNINFFTNKKGTINVFLGVFIAIIVTLFCTVLRNGLKMFFL